MDSARVRWGVTGALAALLAGYWFTSGETLGPWFYLAGQWVAVGAMVAAYVARRHAAPRAWLVVIAAVVCWVLGDTWWSIAAIRGVEVDWVSVADVGYLLEYLLLGGTLVSVVRRTFPQRDIDAALDAAAILVVGVFVMWVLVVEPGLEDAAVPALARGLGAAYPLFDAVLVAVLARLALVRELRTPAVSLALAGAGLCFVADAGYSVLVVTDSYVAGGVALLDMGWIAAVGLWALAALHPSMTSLGQPLPEGVESASSRMAIVAVAHVVAIPAWIAGWFLQGELEAIEYLVVSSVLTVISFLRFLSVLRASNRLRGVVTRREAYFRAMAERSSDGYVVIDQHGQVVDGSPALAGVVGLAPDEVVGVSALDTVHPEDRQRIGVVFLQMLGGEIETWSGEVRLIRGDGTTGWYEARAADLRHERAVGGLVVNLNDVTDRKRAEEALVRQAFHDPLTGLANRALLQDRVQHGLARLSRRTGDVVVLFCDLDGFKTVNDSLGHSAGDRLLQRIAERISAVVRDEDTVARLGGDEFAVLLEGTDAGRRADQVAERILGAVSEPVDLDGTVVVPGISIGIAGAGPDALTAGELLRDADTAMYSAKAAGKGRVARFAEPMRAAAMERMALEADLRTAAADRQLELRLQPVVELDDGRVSGFEALVRWRHPERGLLAPAAFVPLAEETGQIVEIGSWVLRAACEAAAGWADDTLTVAVNVSGRELDDPRYPERVAAALRATGLAAGRLVIEVTETTVIDDPEGVAERLCGLKALGVRLAIDDFGTGYSSLQYLRRFPVDILKIDRSFVDGVIDGDRELPPIVQGLIELGRTLGLEMVAEGIERPGQLDGLRSSGLGLGQGFLFAQPLEPADADALAGALHPVLPTG